MGINEINGVSAQQTKQNAVNTNLYDTKEKRKAAVNQAIQDYMKFNNLSEKDAKKAAEIRVANEQHKEEFETFNNSTVVYVDKKAYKAAKKEYDKAEKEFVKNRAKGVSKKQAREQFAATHQKFELAGVSARRGFKRAQQITGRTFIAADGTLTKDAKDFMVEQANILADEGEETNYRLDLKERRIARTKLNGLRKEGQKKLTVNQLGQMSDAIHLDKEKNMTTPLRLAVAGAIVGTSYGTAYALGGISSSSVSNATAAATAGNAATGAAASAEGAGAAAAFIGPATLGTAGAPLGVLGLLLKDNGKKVKHVIAFNKPQPKQEPQKPEIKPEPKPEPKPEVKPEPKQEVKPEPKPCPEELKPAYCSHKVKYGDNWYNIAKASYKVNGQSLKDGSKELKAIIKAQQLMYGVENNKKGTFFKVGDEYKLYEDYSMLLNNEEIMKKYPQLQVLKDAKIEVDCDAKYKAGKVIKRKFGLVTNKGVDLQNVYDCYGNKVGTKVIQHN